jgi:hypothetical protein
MVTTMGSDRPEESLPARLGGRHPRRDFVIQVQQLSELGWEYLPEPDFRGVRGLHFDE